MAERRKIIIQTGAQANDPLPAPHFDAEATLSARPVVPLSEQEVGFGSKSLWKRPAIVALIILVAAGIGVAAGFAIGFYRNRSAVPVVNTQASPAQDTTQNTTQIAQQPQPEPTPTLRATTSAKTDEASAEAKDEERDRKDEEHDRKAAALKQPKEKEDEEVEATPPPSARDKKRDRAAEDDQVLAGRQAERDRRREERREERRRSDEDEIDIPRQVQRAGQQINRIRDIFEGRQP